MVLFNMTKRDALKEIGKLKDDLMAQNAIVQNAMDAVRTAQTNIPTGQRPYMTAIQRINARVEWMREGDLGLSQGKLFVVTVEKTKDSWVAFYLQDGQPGFLVEQNPEMFPSDMFITALRALAL